MNVKKKKKRRIEGNLVEIILSLNKIGSSVVWADQMISSGFICVRRSNRLKSNNQHARSSKRIENIDSQEVKDGSGYYSSKRNIYSYLNSSK